MDRLNEGSVSNCPEGETMAARHIREIGNSSDGWMRQWSSNDGAGGAPGVKLKTDAGSDGPKS